MLTELLRFELATSDDVAAVRQLTRDVAREAGTCVLVQTKLATAASELARRSLEAAGAADVVYSLRADTLRASLVVAICDSGREMWTPAPTRPSGRDATRRSGLDLRSLRLLVDELDITTEVGGGTRAVAAIALPSPGPDAGRLAQRLAGLRPLASAETLGRRNVELADALTLLEAQSEELEAANAALTRMNDVVASANRELTLTNRGVIDLNAELERRAEELSVANEALAARTAGLEQLADQQSALVELGRLAIASHDAGHLAGDLARVLRRALGVAAVGVLQFDPDAPRLLVVASEGFLAAGQPGYVEAVQGPIHRPLDADLVADLPADLPADDTHYPIPAPPGTRSAAVVPVRTASGPWGVLVASDPDPDRFTAPAKDFIEAAAFLLAFSIGRTSTEDAARYAAFHDGLTGLPNRAELLDRLTQALSDDNVPVEPAAPERQLGVIFIDLDGFKEVNDTLGHAAGDLVLIETASRLRSRNRRCDILARLGGDEFVVLCEQVTEQAAHGIAGRLLAAFDEPFLIEGREVFLSGSAGFALAGAGGSGGRVLDDADIAMYQAKQIRGSATVAYHPEMRDVAEAESYLHGELRRARERGELRAVYQPVVDLTDGIVQGVEVLLRWRHPVLGDVPAQRTVAAAERFGLAWELTTWIAQQGAGVVGAWNAVHPNHVPLRMAVNLTALLLTDPHRVDELEARVRAGGLPFELLDVEITETAFADPTPAVLGLLTEMRRRGARLSMDDFGTGYSSLLALTSLPFDTLKIDRSFVAPLDASGDRTLVSAVSAIAASRRLLTIAEGVETDDQLAALIGARCDMAQGYLFSRPLERAGMATLTAVESQFGETVRRVRQAAGIDHGPAAVRRARGGPTWDGHPAALAAVLRTPWRPKRVPLPDGS